MGFILGNCIALPDLLHPASATGMMLRLMSLPGLILIVLIFGGSDSLQAQTSQARINATAGAISVQSVTVEGKLAPVSPGDGVKLSGSSENIVFRFGPATNGGMARIRLRYRLDGFEHTWN